MCWEEGILRISDAWAESYLRSHEEDVVRVYEERACRMVAEARAETSESCVAELRRLQGV